jgi:NAD-dependent SIR2 family protein deacetylase
MSINLLCNRCGGRVGEYTDKVEIFYKHDRNGLPMCEHCGQDSVKPMSLKKIVLFFAMAFLLLVLLMFK